MSQPPIDPRYGQPGWYPNQQHYPQQYGQHPTPYGAPGYPAQVPAGYPAHYQQHQGHPAGYGGPAHPVQPPALTSSDPTVEVQWLPSTQDIPQVDKWFSELDKEGRGIVGGLEIANFLKRSNLPKETLRTMWSIVDSKNLGYVNKSQFNNLIRLVSISCSPIYMGAPPSMERLQKTLYDKIPLPSALYEAPAVVTAAAPAPAPAAPVPAPMRAANYGMPPAGAGYGYPAPGPTGQHMMSPHKAHGGPSAHTADDDDEFSDFASATPSSSDVSSMKGMPGGGARSGLIDAALDDFGPLSAGAAGPQWVPLGSDVELIDKWFAELDLDKKGVVGGLAIATFLKRSNLPKEALRTIWSLVDSRNAGHVNKQQFTNIIRLVAISCSPIYMGAAPTLERLEKTLSVAIPLPTALVGDAVGATTSTTAVDASATVYSTVSMQRTPSGLTSAPAPAAPAPPPVAAPEPAAPAVAVVQWTPSSIDAPYIDKWFADLDPESKGTIGGAAVVPFLQKSLLPKEALRAIWSLVDSARLGFVNKAQFANMMRLVAIQCHPAHSAQPPSMERLQQTLGDFIPLPLSIVHDPLHSPHPLPPVAPVPVPADVPGTAVPTLGTVSSGSAPSAGPDADLQWLPAEPELSIVAQWFAELDVEKTGLVGGLAVAMFLKRSNLPREALRAIWSLVDSKNAGHVDKQQFTNIIRLVSIQCSPAYCNYAPSLEGLRHTLSERIPLPASLVGEVQSSAPVPVPDAAPVQTSMPASAPSEDSLPSLPAAAQWVPSAADAAFVDRWFAELDQDGKGLVGGLAIATFLKRSNLPKEALRTIWSLVDNRNTGHVNKQQFTNIIRLVSISCSPIYMGAAPTLERLEKTINDDISLPYALTNPALVEAMAATPAPVASAQSAQVVDVEDEDEMGDFSSAPGSEKLPSDFAAPALARVGSLGSAQAPSAGGHRLSVFDELVESDLMVHDEDWEDFEHAKHPESAVTAPAEAAPGAVPEFALAGATVPDPVTSVHVADESDPFGSFDEADTPAAVVGDSGTSTSAPAADPFASLDLADAPLPAEPAAIATADPFGSFDQADASVPGVAASTVVSVPVDPFASLDLEDTPPSAFLSAAPVVDLFGSVDQTESQIPAPHSLVMAPRESVDHFGSFEVQDEPIACAGGVEDAFGSFDQGDIAPPSEAPQVPLEISQPDVFGDADFGDAAFEGDDFGDFETHTPVPGGALPQQQSTSSLFEFNEPPPISQSVSEMSLFDPPAVNSSDDMFMQDAFSGFGAAASSNAPAELDLLDFLSEPAASVPAAKSAASAQSFEPVFNAFDQNTPLGHTPVPPATAATFPSINSSAMLDDFFAADPASSKGASSSSSSSTAPDAALFSRKPASYQVLESWTATLTKKCLFEHAYNCNEQAKLARAIRELSDRKTRAVEEDDLETAMILKKDINVLQLKVQGVDQEAYWEEMAASNRRGDSLQETADLLGAVDEIMAGKFKRRFLSAVPPSSAPLDTQLLFQITARRYARMILATCSTHSEYPRQWLLVLQIAVAKVKEGNDIIARFKKLSVADRNSLISHLKMSEYALGLVAISEIGMWVSASCIEAMVHEKIAQEVYSVCQDLLSEVDVLWGMGSRFKTVNLDALTAEAAKHAENKHVQYCNFTLRPLGYEAFKLDGGKVKTSMVKLYDNPVRIENAHFMEPVIKLWLHDISKSLPQCAAEAF